MIRFPQVPLTNRWIGHKCGTAFLDARGTVRPTIMLASLGSSVGSQPSRVWSAAPGTPGGRPTGLDFVKPKRDQVSENVSRPEGKQA